MNGVRWTSCCAVFGVLIVGVSISARAQDDPLAIDRAAEESPFADPAPVAEGTPADEKSVLADRHTKHEADSGDFCRCVGDAHSVAGSRIERVLRSPLRSSGLDFTDTPLNDVVNVLQDEYGIPIQLDTPALEETGLGTDEPVTVNIHNVSLRSALRLMLKPLHLTYIIRDEVLLITTPEAAESQLLLCVYDIRSLMDDASDKSVKAVIDTIVACVATETWAVHKGGEAEIRPLKPGLLVISQTQAVHEEIRALLETIRELRQPEPAVAAASAAPRASDARQVVTRPYFLQITQPGDADKVRAQVRDLIVQSIPDEQWSGRLDDGQPVVLSVLPDRVILRHKPAVHDKVQTLLTESGLAVRTAAEAGMPSGAGGGGGFFQPDRAYDR